jgi:predicted CXXCH cytochrome family protein
MLRAHPRLLPVFLVFLSNCPAATLTCGVCHPAESAAFANSAMGQSVAAPVRTVPSGRVVHRDSGAIVNSMWTKTQMFHRLTELGFSAEYQIGFQIGAGKVGHSYIAQLGPYLLQSPISFYARYGWDVSPGFKDSVVLDFDRVLGDKCLFCHAQGIAFSGPRRLAAGSSIEAIDCARCHGDTREHVRHPARSNIVNPVRLPTRARDSVCEQCHLEGVARVLNPGKTLQDFHAGDELEIVMSIYVDDHREPGEKIVSQVEQLARSRCARESDNKLWCGTCHDPHGSTNKNRASQVNAVCKSCHGGLSTSTHPSGTADCVACHMPRLGPNDVAHAGSTDHQILARPVKRTGDSLSGSLRPWHEPASAIRQRNLGLAELEASALSEFHWLGEAAGGLLAELPQEQRENDPVVLAALGDIALSRGNATKSEVLFRKAFELAPSNSEYLMYLGIALKQKGDLAAAAGALQNALAIDPSLQRACLELSALYAQQKKPREASDVLNDYLKWNPQSIVVRSALQGIR